MKGGSARNAVVALEPMTGFYDSLAVAWEKKQVAVIEPGEVKQWTLSVWLGTGNQPFPGDERPLVG